MTKKDKKIIAEMIRKSIMQERNRPRIVSFNVNELAEKALNRFRDMPPGTLSNK